MEHTYDPALSPDKRKAEVQKYYDSLHTARENFLLRKEQNDCPVRDVNEFEILTRLDSSPLSITYRAESNSKHYAIKRTFKFPVRHEGLCEAVINEKMILHAMRGNPFVIELFASFKDKENLYLIMECAEYGTLQSFHNMHAFQVPEVILRPAIAQVVLGLQYVHACGIMHRGVEPERILVSTRGRVKLGDFGRASDRPGQAPGGFGWAYYRAPEAYTDNMYNEAVDWWALGIMTYHLVSDEHPFCEEIDIMYGEDIYEFVAKGDIKFSRSTIARTSAAFKDLISQLLDRDPTKRIGSLREGSRAVQNHEWFKSIDWYEMLYGAFPLRIEYETLVVFTKESRQYESHPFKEHSPDSEDPQHEDFKDY